MEARGRKFSYLAEKSTVFYRLMLGWLSNGAPIHTGTSHKVICDDLSLFAQAASSGVRARARRSLLVSLRLKPAWVGPASMDPDADSRTGHRCKISIRTTS